MHPTKIFLSDSWVRCLCVRHQSNLNSSPNRLWREVGRFSSPPHEEFRRDLRPSRRCCCRHTAALHLCHHVGMSLHPIHGPNNCFCKRLITPLAQRWGHRTPEFPAPSLTNVFVHLRTRPFEQQLGSRHARGKVWACALPYFCFQNLTAAVTSTRQKHMSWSLASALHTTSFNECNLHKTAKPRLFRVVSVLLLAEDESLRTRLFPCFCVITFKISLQREEKKSTWQLKFAGQEKEAFWGSLQLWETKTEIYFLFKSFHVGAENKSSAPANTQGFWPSLIRFLFTESLVTCRNWLSR